MPTELFANTATTTLSAAITTTGATTLTVASSALFPAAVAGVSQFRIKIDTEYLIVTNVAGTTWTVTRGAEGSTAATHLNAAPVTHVLTAGSLGAIASPTLAVFSYSTGTDIAIPVTSTVTDIDAANILITFTAPPSGLVVITVAAAFDAVGLQGIVLVLREGATEVSAQRRVLYIGPEGTRIHGTATCPFIITGLTPGTSHTYKLAAKNTSSPGTANINHGPSWGPVTMVVSA